MKSYLDAAQTGSGAIQQVALYVDMCYAGVFVRRCSGAPGLAERVVIGSTTDRQLANFGGADGSLSFTGFFLPQIVLGGTYRDAFQIAREVIGTFRSPANAPQLPWLDDNGDGVPTTKDGATAATITLGVSGGFGVVPPVIPSVESDETLTAPANTELWVITAPDQVDRVVAYVSFEGANHPDGFPVTGQVAVSLSLDGTQPRRRSGVLPAAAMPQDGIYNILYVAEAKDLKTGLSVAGVPAARQLILSTLGARGLVLGYAVPAGTMTSMRMR